MTIMHQQAMHSSIPGTRNNSSTGVGRSLPVGDDDVPTGRYQQQHQQQQQHHRRKTINRGRRISNNTLDKDIDEEFLLDISAPPPPPSTRRNWNNQNNNGNSSSSSINKQYQLPPSPRDSNLSSPRRLHLQQQQQRRSPQQQQQQFNFHEQQNPQISSPKQQQHHHHQPKDTSNDSSVPRYQNPNDSPRTPTRTKKKISTPTSTSRPLKTPSPRNSNSNSKGAEYGSRLVSFHQVMLENIEKEALLIRRQGSFGMIQQQTKTNQADNNSDPSSNDPDGGARAAPGRTTLATPSPRNNRRRSFEHERHGNNGNGVESLLKETMNDISSAAASTMKTLQSAIQHTKERASSAAAGSNDHNRVVAAVAPIACVSINAAAFQDDFAFVNDDDKISNTPTNNTTSGYGENNEKNPQRLRSGNRRTAAGASLPAAEYSTLPKSSSGTELMKRMHDVFKKVVVDATTSATGDSDGASRNYHNNDIVQRRNDRGDRRGDEENNKSDWGVGNILANGFGWDGEEEDDEDQRSRATYDTWDDENSVLRRLGSWGTINSQYTAGTAGTAATFGTLATYDTEGGPSVVGPVSAAVAAASAAKLAGTEGGGKPGVVMSNRDQPRNGEQLIVSGTHYKSSKQEVLHDDNGQRIDPLLVEARALKKQQYQSQNEGGSLPKAKTRKRRERRKKVVRFDYPPIKSLRQYTRPDPEDLPKLFFTEDELDQIEDDRYSTMSTDDIEIVAVSSKEAPSTNSAHHEGNRNNNYNHKTAVAGRRKKISGTAAPPVDYEPGCKPVKGRHGTPIRRRPHGGNDDSNREGGTNAASSSGQKPSSPRRLVKGVQIYLRERSTGA